MMKYVIVALVILLVVCIKLLSDAYMKRHTLSAERLAEYINESFVGQPVNITFRGIDVWNKHIVEDGSCEDIELSDDENFSSKVVKAVKVVSPGLHILFDDNSYLKILGPSLVDIRKKEDRANIGSLLGAGWFIENPKASEPSEPKTTFMVDLFDFKDQIFVTTKKFGADRSEQKRIFAKSTCKLVISLAE